MSRIDPSDMVGQDQELLRAERLAEDPARLGVDLDLRQPRGPVEVGPAPLGDPVAEQSMGRVRLAEPGPAAVGHLPGRLAEHQAGLGLDRVGPPGPARPGQDPAVGDRVVAHHRERESPLAAGRAVAAARVAPRLGQGGDHLVAERDRLGRGRVRDLDLDPAFAAPDPDDHRRPAVARRPQDAARSTATTSGRPGRRWPIASGRGPSRRGRTR